MKRRGFSKTELVVIVLVMSCLLAPLVPAPIQLVFLLAFGWIVFLWRVIPQMNPDWGVVALFAIALALFTGGLHALFRWLYAAVHESRPVWSWRWTAACVTIVVMLFVAGTSMVGVTHQVAWIATAKEPFFRPPMASLRMQSSFHLKQFGVSLHNYHDERLALPAMLADSQGEALHGWMTMILPYVEQQPLYDSIDLKSAWDESPNRKAMQTQVKAFMMPKQPLATADAADYALAHYAGNVHVLGGTEPRPFAEIKDGLSNTILAGEAAGDFKPWGHPRNWRDPAAGLNASPDGFGGPWHAGGAQFVMGDGSVRFIPANVDPAVLRALATPAGGDQPPAEY
jgi:prepilin-type processing-associated H-X9-DG protein